MVKISHEQPCLKIIENSNDSHHCNFCKRITNHKLLFKADFQSTYYAEDDYDNSVTSYETVNLIQCQGCMQPSIFNVKMDSEDVDYSEDGLSLITRESYYPPRKDIFEFDGHYLLPQALSDLYSETIGAINNELHTIAGIGIRGLIETICNQEKIEGNNLCNKIDNLFSEGKISRDSKEILHALRKTYNKSAHDSFKPSRAQLEISLEIIELLMKQIYVHKSETEKHFQIEKPQIENK